MREEELNQLRLSIQQISNTWFRNRRPNNAGGVGNTLEDLLGVPENNIPMPDFGAWELKSQRDSTSSLVTLFHTEPEPRHAHIIPQILLPIYGWRHQEAGTTYPETERSFRQTISGVNYSDRGFKVFINQHAHTIYVDMDAQHIDHRHIIWKNEVMRRVDNRQNLTVQPYWTFDSLNTKLQTKLHNLVFVRAETKIDNNTEWFRYNHIHVFIQPTLERFLNLLQEGVLFVDFDARTGHNHGTKFRIKSERLTDLYSINVTNQN